MSQKFQKEMNEAINDDLAVKIAMRHITKANGLVAVYGLHKILERMRNNEYTRVNKIGYCNLQLQRAYKQVIVTPKGKDPVIYDLIDRR